MANVTSPSFGSTAVAVSNTSWIYNVTFPSVPTAVSFDPTFTAVIPAFTASAVPSPVLIQVVGGGGSYLIGHVGG